MAPLSMLFMAVNIVLYIICAMRSNNFNQISGQVLVQMGGSMREGLWENEWLRLIAPNFLHVNFMHILVNSITLRNLAPSAEVYFGSANFGTLYLLSGITGFAFSQLFGGHLAAGASASLFGLLGAHLVIQILRTPVLKYAWRSSEVRQLVFWCALYFALGVSGMMGPIDNWGHLGGFIGGSMLAGLFELWRRNKRVSAPVLVAVLLIFALIIGAARWTFFSPYYHIHMAVLAREDNRTAEIPAQLAQARKWAKTFHMTNEIENFITLFEAKKWNRTMAWQRSYDLMGQYLRQFPPALFKESVAELDDDDSQE